MADGSINRIFLTMSACLQNSVHPDTCRKSKNKCDSKDIIYLVGQYSPFPLCRSFTTGSLDALPNKMVLNGNFITVSNCLSVFDHFAALGLKGLTLAFSLEALQIKKSQKSIISTPTLYINQGLHDLSPRK